MGSQRKIRVAVVFGGRSAEHAVSCASAGLFLAAIDRGKYDVVPIGIARDGRWVLTSGDVSRLALSAGELPSVEAVATPPSIGSVTEPDPSSVGQCRKAARRDVGRRRSPRRTGRGRKQLHTCEHWYGRAGTQNKQ